MSRNSFSIDARENDCPREPRHELRNAPAPEIPAGRLDRSNVFRDAERGCQRLRAEGEERQAVFLAGRTFLLRPSQLQTMIEMGTFRVVAAADLARFAYGGNWAQMERDLRRMKAHGLLTDSRLPVSGRKVLRVIALTKSGHRVVRAAKRVPEDQALYHGIVKPREARHDAELYRLFQHEAARIEESGGRPLRVVLDYELRRVVNRKRARLGEKSTDFEEIKCIAAECGLRVVDGKIPIPDVRIEYQTAACEIRRIDLELATRHYHRQGVAEKARAGFSLYSPREDASHLHRLLDKQEITAGFVAL
jgi:DNA-binding PadR family transcriptional regulator